MSESSRPRRSAVVVVLDAMLGLATAVQTGNLPGVRSGDGRTGRRAGVAWLVAGVLVAVGGTALLVSAVLRTPDGLADLPPAGAVAAPAPAPSSGAAEPGTTRPSPSRASPVASAVAARPSASAASPAVPSSAASSAGGSRLTAAYAAADGLFGYRATVTVASEGPDAAADWRLTITLPRPTLRVAAVSGATAEQDGAVWTFTPVEATRRIAAGESVEVAFDVRGATLVDAKPTDCEIDGQPCAGLA